MYIHVFGNVEIDSDSTVVTLQRAGERCVLATLALNLGHRVYLDTLVEHVWADDPPDNAEDTVASYVRAVRRAIEHAGGQRDWLRSYRPGAYQLDVDPACVDYHRFTALVADAARKGEAQDAVAAIAAYQEALAQRRGPALANVTGRWVENCRISIENEYAAALRELFTQQLAAGQYTAVAVRVDHLFNEIDPTDDMIVMAVTALARSGRRADVPGFIARAARRMREKAGVEPSPEVHRIARNLVRQANAVPDPPVAPDVGPAATTRSGDTVVVMGASHSGQVYHSAGDQYIAGS